jgi:hypothetical protein
MRRQDTFLAALFILLFVAPGTPTAAGTTPPAGPNAPSATFNVVRLGLYPPLEPENVYYRQVLVHDNTAYLAHNAYNSAYPWLSEASVDEYDVTDPWNPHFVDQAWSATGRMIKDIDGFDRVLALALSLEGYSGSAGGLEVAGPAGKICGVDLDHAVYGMAYSVAMSQPTVYVGVGKGLVVVDYQIVSNEQCHVGQHFSSSPVYDIVQIADKLYLGQSDGVRVVSDDAINEYAFYPTPHPLYNVAVSYTKGSYIYAATEYGLYFIDGTSGLIVTHYGPDDRVAVTLQEAWDKAYVGTSDDLRVLDISDRTAPKLIGAYADWQMEFEYSLSSDVRGLVHSTKGIFQHRPDLWLEAKSAGVAVNGATLPPGSSIVAGPGDQVTFAAPLSAVALKLKCAADALQEPVSHIEARHTAYAAGTIWAIGSIGYEDWVKTACQKPKLMAPIEADPPALPLSLVSGSLQTQVLAAAGAVKVDTTCANSQAAGGSTFQTSHDPSAGVSQFVCLAGTLQVQPTAAGAPPLTLGPAQFVNVTAAGAGPIGQLRFIYVPLVRR